MMSDAWDHPSLREINTLGLNSNEQIRREYCYVDEQDVVSAPEVWTLPSDKILKDRQSALRATNRAMEDRRATPHNCYTECPLANCTLTTYRFAEMEPQTTTKTFNTSTQTHRPEESYLHNFNCVSPFPQGPTHNFAHTRTRLRQTCNQLLCAYTHASTTQCNQLLLTSILRNVNYITPFPGGPKVHSTHTYTLLQKC